MKPLDIPTSPSPVRLDLVPPGLAWSLPLRVTWLVLACAVPTTGLLVTGHLELAASAFWGLYGLFGLVLVLAGRSSVLLGFSLAVLPWMNLLRGLSFAFYNVTVVVLALVVGYFALRHRGWLATLWGRSRLWRWLVLMVGLYYGLSLVHTGSYVPNLRMFEMLLVVAGVLLAGRSWELLAGAMRGLVLSAGAIGVGLLPHQGSLGRLGMAEIGGQTVGNPVQLGMALALGLFVLALDRGWWAALRRSRFWRGALMVGLAGLLLLTTSRAAWLVTAVGLLVAVVFGSRQRARLLWVGAVALMVALVVWLSPLGAMLRAGLERTFGQERSWRQRTSGRTDQWRVAFRAATDSPLRTWVGYGPGLGPAVYAHFSEEVEEVRYGVGRSVALHSLFMQVLVETGLVGLLVLCGWLAAGLVQVGRWTRHSRQVLPLVCYLAYVLVIFTVSGHDTISGAALGLGLLPGLERRRQLGAVPPTRRSQP